MAVIHEVRTYRCDGCGFKSDSPHEWRTFTLVGSGVLVTSFGNVSSSEDYCQGCVQKMRAALRAINS